MPQVQVVNTTRDKPEPTGIHQFFSKLNESYKEVQDRDMIGSILDEYQQNTDKAQAWENAVVKLEKSTISPSRRIQAQKTLNEVKKNIIEQDKALNSRYAKGMKSQEDREVEKQRLINDGYPEEEADIYVDSPPSVKQSLERNHRMEKARQLRNSPSQIKSQETTQQQVQPSSTEQQVPVQETNEQWPELQLPEGMIPAEKIKWQNNNEKENTKELKKLEDKNKAYRNNSLLINSLTKVNESKKLPSGLSKGLQIDRDTGEIRPTAQLLGVINPETELYVKNLNQFVKGAKDFFGTRVTNFDLQSFMQQLPRLSNSEQGRRLILKQMQLVNDLEAVHSNELDKAIKHYGRNANYIDISRTVDERVAQKESALLGKIDNVVEASNQIEKMSKNPEKFKDAVLMQDTEGKWKAVKKDKVKEYEDKEWSVY
jgi:hypothetical protein